MYLDDIFIEEFIGITIQIGVDVQSFISRFPIL